MRHEQQHRHQTYAFICISTLTVVRLPRPARIPIPSPRPQLYGLALDSEGSGEVLYGCGETFGDFTDTTVWTSNYGQAVVFAIDTTTHETIWLKSFSSEPTDRADCFYTIVVEDGRIYVSGSTGGIGFDSAGRDMEDQNGAVCHEIGGRRGGGRSATLIICSDFELMKPTDTTVLCVSDHVAKLQSIFCG